MIIGFTGPQCSGKTTLATQVFNSLKTKSEDITFQFEPIIPKDLLDITSKELELVQCLTLNHHIKPLMQYEYNKKVSKMLITDRTILDAFLYTNYFAKQQSLPEEILRFSNYLLKKLITKYNIIFYCDIETIPLEDNGIRSTDEQFRQDIANEFNKFIKTNSTLFTNSNVEFKILTGTPDQRFNSALSTINYHISKNLC